MDVGDARPTGPLEDALVVELPAPVGPLTLQGDNAAFSTFRRTSRARGLGPLTGTGRPGGIDLRDPGAEPETSSWACLDYESFPLLIHALAEAHHPRLGLREVEKACTPRVIEAIVEPVTRYLLRVLKPMLVPVDRNGGAPADPPGARQTPTSSSGRSGPTPSAR